MRIVCQQTILVEYHALFVIFEKNSNNLKLSSAANYRHFIGLHSVMCGQRLLRSDWFPIQTNQYFTSQRLSFFCIFTIFKNISGG